MKYGVIVYSNTKNIGDDIQSYAASKLLPQVDYYIDREQMDIFRPLENEPVNTIMNGWFMYNKLAWPVSPCINPLYISMHFWKHDALGIGSDYLDEFGREDLCAHGPVGCRDTETRQMLEEKGIPTWLSGCVTMTLKPIYPKTEGDYICLVNVSERLEKWVRTRYPNEKFIVVDQEAENMVRQEADWTERFANVEKLLTLYQNAKFVFTTRLHCALPCLALGTPVVLVSQQDIAETGRFDGLRQYVRCAAEEDLLTGNTVYNLQSPEPNSEEFRRCANIITERVTAFVEANRVCTPELRARFERYDSEWVKRAEWKNRQLYNLSRSAIQRWNENAAWLNELQAAKDWNANKVQELENRLRREHAQIEKAKTLLHFLKRK